MKLSAYKKDGIKQNILSIFDKPEKVCQEEENSIVVDNYMAWIPQYQAVIDSLPTGFVHLDKNVHIDIMSKTDPEEREARWYGNLPEKKPVIKEGSGYYSDPIAIPVMDVMLDRIEKLLTKLDGLSKEKTTLSVFVEECLDKVNTTKQLRELWAQYPALAKHIPAEPIRKKKGQQQVLDLDSKLDIDAVNKRLTENLLEG